MKESLRNLLNTFLPESIQIIGMGTGTYIGFIAGGSDGAFLGTVLGEVIGRTTKDIIDRKLSNNERDRVDFVACFAGLKIKKALESGSRLRDDNFFQKIHERIDAEEIFEGLLIKSKSTYQEKKLPFIANIFVNAAFKEISPEEIHHILNLTDQISYPQLILINVIGSEVAKNHDHNKISDRNIDNKVYSITYYDLIDLQTKGLIQDIYNYGDLAVTGDKTIEIKDCILTKLGEITMDLMSLNEIPEEEIKAYIKKMSPKYEFRNLFLVLFEKILIYKIPDKY